nr:MAG TPA: protein of unknown function (DUF4083) [Bacteriophage sp.]
MEKNYLKSTDGIMLLFLIGVLTLVIWSLSEAVDNLSIKMVQIEKQIDTIK